MEALIQTCLEESPVDLLHGNVVNVYTGDICESYVA